ncbi:hypothetical protein [Streptomyces erythrochromogenes]|uniref:hypothetical protein n=1 Tax=Streptomyces erythrochromogenes TaxID=285574 RepID=UPI0037FEAA0D
MQALPELNPETFSQFIDKVNEDHDVKLGIIQGVQTSGFAHVLEQHFALSEFQRSQVKAVGSGSKGTATWDQLLTLALTTNGKITFSQKGNGAPELQAFVRSVEVDIHIECEA